jgi:tripartite-type tricarboxylate transporter receptor subunit TctC
VLSGCSTDAPKARRATQRRNRCFAIAVERAKLPGASNQARSAFTPGSPNDVMARLPAQHLQSRLGQSLVIENKPGGGTTIGTKSVAIAEPNGRLAKHFEDPVSGGRYRT